MPGCKVLIILSLLTSHRSAGQNPPMINITLDSHAIEYNTSCPGLEGMLQFYDYLMLTANLTIHGFELSFDESFGLSTEPDVNTFLTGEADSSRCSPFSEVTMDRCVCLHLEHNEVQLSCRVMALCKMSGRLYFYMKYHNTYYFTESISILKTYALCENPPGPFAQCVHSKEKRVLTDPFNRSLVRSSCRGRLLHGVDRFNMTGRVYLKDIPRSFSVLVHFGVLDKEDNTSITSLGANITLNYRICVPPEQNVSISCACLGFEPDGFRVVCTFLASLNYSEQFGFFLINIGPYQYVGDTVRMPLVLDKCEEMERPKKPSYLLIYITLLIITVLIIGLLVYGSYKAYNQKVEEEEIREMQIKYDGESSVDAPVHEKS